jgi:predicted nucleotide-binding protein
MDMSPGSSTFRMLCGASIAYGLTEGGYNAESISITQLGLRIVAPEKENDDELAKKEAALLPKTIKDFLGKYQNATLPVEKIANNVLVSLGVPSEKTDKVYKLILENAQEVGFLKTIKGKQYVDLTTSSLGNAPLTNNEDIREKSLLAVNEESTPDAPNEQKFANNNRRVFITHGSNKQFIEPIKKLLGFGELDPVVSTEQQTVSQPIPDKVISDMRSCGAAIIHVDSEERLISTDDKEHVVLNPNVLIEIGAAMALYDRRFILLVKNGISLPSNLQGLYEVRYTGENLDGEATIRLLGAINDIKNHKLP